MTTAIDWKDYAFANDDEIRGFFGDYFFLCNFKPCEVKIETEVYPSSEHAYMAHKTLLVDERKKFLVGGEHVSSADAKAAGRKLKLREDWDDVKDDIMFTCVWSKFIQNPELKQRLLETKDKYLEETNHWGDEYWGVNYKTNVGLNTLGLILMRVRDILR